jgi:hypothetical protein
MYMLVFWAVLAGYFLYSFCWCTDLIVVVEWFLGVFIWISQKIGKSFWLLFCFSYPVTLFQWGLFAGEERLSFSCVESGKKNLFVQKKKEKEKFISKYEGSRWDTFSIDIILMVCLEWIMIQCHSNIQLFTTFPIWQGGPLLLFEFFFKIN